MKNKLEIMAPAGSFESLNAALKAGADSIYFGVAQLNMRSRSAKRFKLEDIVKVVTMCSELEVKTYLTLNTIIYDHELELMREICRTALQAGITAVIVADMAAIQYAKSLGLKVHVSTQCNISNIEALRYYANFADAVVLARELTLEQIQAICKAIEDEGITGPSGELIKVEVFIHGALCVSISGKCYMSLALNGHSANRGDCLQNCRRRYRVTDTETGQELIIDNKYVMSPADLCTITILDKLAAAGVSIFKIEGRGRAADYVFRVTSVYRKALSKVQNDTFTVTEAEMLEKELAEVFNRKFWQNGYYLGKPLGEWADSYGSQSTRRKIFCGRVTNYYKKACIAEIKVQDELLAIGDELVILGETTGCEEVKVSSIYIDDHAAETAGKGQKATIPVKDVVRRNDKVFIVRNRPKA